MRITEAAVKVAMGAEVDGHPPPVADAAPEARRVKITMKVLQEFGYTESCKQCDHIRAFNEHKAGIAHSEVCRKRIMTAMAATTRGAARLETRNSGSTELLPSAFDMPMRRWWLARRRQLSRRTLLTWSPHQRTSTTSGRDSAG